jgi:hypothetical protein
MRRIHSKEQEKLELSYSLRLPILPSLLLLDAALAGLCGSRRKMK